MACLALKGNIIYCDEDRCLVSHNNAYLVAENNRIAGVFPVLPPAYAHAAVKDYGDALIIPGLVDLHFHGPQVAFAPVGMDMELLPWLEAWMPRTRVMHIHGIGERDHQSLAMVDHTKLDAVLAALIEQGYSGALTMEIFSEEDFITSVAAIRASLERLDGKAE